MLLLTRRRKPSSLFCLRIQCKIACLCFSCDFQAGCPVVAALLHYFLLALFSWMLCEGLLLFINVMKPHQTKSILGSKIQYFYIFGWGRWLFTDIANPPIGPYTCYQKEYFGSKFPPPYKPSSILTCFLYTSTFTERCATWN